MPKLKYKNGSTWTELNLGAGGLDEYPVGSFYTSPYSLMWLEPTSYTRIETLDLQKSIKSPSALFGGNWVEIKQPFDYNHSYLFYCLYSQSSDFILDSFSPNVTYLPSFVYHSNLPDAYNKVTATDTYFNNQDSANKNVFYLYKNSDLKTSGIYTKMIFPIFINKWTDSGNLVSNNNNKGAAWYHCFRMWQRIA